jgi:hypothetical protein
VFFGRASLIDQIVQFERIGVDSFPTHLATAHTLTLGTASLHLIMNILA